MKNIDLLLIIFLVLLFTNKLFGQDKFFNKVSVSPQVGFYSNVFDKSSGFNYGVDLSVKKNATLYTLSYSKLDEFEIFGPTPSEFYHQLGIMMGKSGGDKTQLHFQAGLASAWGITRTEKLSSGFISSDYATEKFVTFGLQAKAGFRFIPAKFFGFGFDLQTNITPKLMTILFLVSIDIGRLR
jgi:hypothetical protein